MIQQWKTKGSSLILCFTYYFSVVHFFQQLQVAHAVANVLFPSELTKPDGYEHLTALFGKIPYGYSKSIQANTVYAGAENDMCSRTINSKLSDWKHPFILMIDRGGCTFVQKVRNAQYTGAIAVVIADNACQCDDVDNYVCILDPNKYCERRMPIMSDDGSGSDVTIPSVLLFKQDADPIKDYILGKNVTDITTVRMELSWPIPNPDDRVEWELWTSPMDKMSMEFKIDFKQAVMALNNSYFSPRMFIYDGLEARCRSAEGKNLCSNLCTNLGRYCATDPDNNLEIGVSGADVVGESARRLCIWELHGDDGIGEQWWDYFQAFEVNCNTAENFTNDECIKSVMLETGIEYDDVEGCITDSGGLVNENENSILEHQLYEKESRGIDIMPIVFVNGIAIGGRVDFVNVFNAICAGYLPGSAPLVCNRCTNCSDEKECVVTGICSDPTPSSSGTPSMDPSMKPSMKQTNEPTLFPSIHPSEIPSVKPSPIPSSIPSSKPTNMPSLLPSKYPSKSPSMDPSETPSIKPSLIPSSIPSSKPTNTPSLLPSIYPSMDPSETPSIKPSLIPSSIPSSKPTNTPSLLPSKYPSKSPSMDPSEIPSVKPSPIPSSMPSSKPTNVPSLLPSIYPSMDPSETPSVKPSLIPSSKLANIPSLFPSIYPSKSPSMDPSAKSSIQPSLNSTVEPSLFPSMYPSFLPTAMKSEKLSVKPSTRLSHSPSNIPSKQPSSETAASNGPSLMPSKAPPSTQSITMSPSIQKSSGSSISPSTSNAPSIQSSEQPSPELSEPITVVTSSPSVTIESSATSTTGTSILPTILVSVIVCFVAIDY